MFLLHKDPNPFSLFVPSAFHEGSTAGRRGSQVLSRSFVNSAVREVIAKLLSKEKVLLFLYGKLFPHKDVAEASEGAVLPAVGTGPLPQAHAGLWRAEQSLSSTLSGEY